MEAVTSDRFVLIRLVGKLISRINTALKLSVPASLETSDAGHEDDAVPRNLIEEFDPGSA
jgi:hypothetical protein